MNFFSKCFFAAVVSCAIFTASTSSAQSGIDLTNRQEVEGIRCFAEPVVPYAEPTTSDTQAIGFLLLDYSTDYTPRKLDAIKDWAIENPKSPWSVSLLMNAGKTYFQTGYFSKAMESWKQGWEIGKNVNANTARDITDTCFGELAMMYGRVGRMADLEALYATKGDRTIQGPGAVYSSHARDGLGVMKTNPGVAFKCGPYALISIRKSQKLPNALHKTLLDAKSTTEGFSLSEVKDLAAQVGMSYEIVKVENAAQYPVPSVVHWNLGHFGALTEYKNGKYHLEDPTFGRDFWMTKEAIASETSGYFIIPQSSVTQSYQIVSSEIASSIRGKGNTLFSNPRGTTSCDYTVGGSGGCSSCGRCSITSPWSPNMPSFTMHPSLGNLSIFDTPIGYNPPYGPPVNFNISYNSREYDQPSTFNFSNFGHNWSFTWISYLTIDSNDPATAKPIVYLPGGGSDSYHFWNSTTNCYERSDIGSAKLKLASTSPLRYELIQPDGSKQVYSLIETSTGSFKRLMMTSIVDADNFALTMTYDGSFRLTSVTDAQGGITTICYEPFCGSPIDKKIRKITDRYGRSAVFGYDAYDRLNSITDTINLTTTFDYDATDFITSMNTPYGSTLFATGENTDGTTIFSRWLQATDPLGDVERVEYFEISSGIPNLFNNNDLPDAPMIYNGLNSFRNAFYWSKSAMKTGNCLLENAKIMHFIHDNNISVTGRLIEWVKEPLEDHVYYFYEDQESGTEYGTGNSVTSIARLLDDGSTQKTDMTYNDQGNLESITDPVGRTTKVEYDVAGEKPTAFKQETSGGDVTLKTIAYGSTSKLPETITDASGAVTTIVYNGFKQPTSISNDYGETFTFDYSTTGLLKRQISDDINAYLEFSYDNFDRITSVTSFPDNYTVRYEYDAGNRITKITYPDNTYEQQVYDKLNVVASRDRAGRWSQMRYSLLGQLETVTNPAGETIQYNWCSCGSPSRIVDADGKITSFIRDVKGRLTKQQGPDLSETSYTYEPRSGRLATKTDPKGQITHFAYNVDDTLFKTWITNVPSGTAPASDLEFVYDDEFKRLKSWEDNLGITELEYVPYNSSDSVYGDGKLYTTTNPWSGDVITNVYDRLGARIQQSVGGNQYYEMNHYDSSGRVTSSTNNLGTSVYDYVPHTGRMTEIDGPLLSTYFGYEGKNQDFALKSIDTPSPFGDGGRFFDYEHDVLGRITKWDKGVFGADESPDEYTAEYDNSDRLTGLTLSSVWDGLKARWDWRISKSENRLNTQYERIVENESVNLQRQKYTVNDADQLLSVESGGPLHVSGTANEQSKISTGLSNAPVLTKADGTFSAWVDTNLLNSATFAIKDFLGNTTNKTVNAPSAVASPSYYFTYDANGNMTSCIGIDTDGISAIYEAYFTWDSRNQLVGISYGDTSTEFAYDGMGRRIRITELYDSEVATDKFYLWSGLKIIASGDYDTPGIANATKKYFDDGFMLGNRLYYYTKDHLGSIVKVTDAYEDEVRVTYDPYGIPSLWGDYADDVDFLYTGHFYHRPSGLYLAPYRVYDPRFGRWLSKEPLGLDGPNLYQYAFSNPLNYSDPTGLVISARCQKLISDISRKWKDYLDDLRRYDPVEDGKGGHPCPWNSDGKTKPGGHFKELMDRRRGLLNDLQTLVKECIKDRPPDDRPRYPREVDEGIRRPIPLPEFPSMPFYAHIPGSNGVWNGVATAGGICAVGALTVATFGGGSSAAPILIPFGI